MDDNGDDESDDDDNDDTDGVGNDDEYLNDG